MLLLAEASHVPLPEVTARALLIVCAAAQSHSFDGVGPRPGPGFRVIELQKLS
jgi:hypothetical protein